MCATFNLFGFDAEVLYLFGRIDIVDVIRDLAEIAALNGVSQRQYIELNDLTIVADGDLFDAFGCELLRECADLFA